MKRAICNIVFAAFLSFLLYGCAVKETEGNDVEIRRMSFVNRGDTSVTVGEWCSDTVSIVAGENASPAFWAFIGSSSESREDWIRPLDRDTCIANYMGMNDSDYGGGIPAAVVWTVGKSLAVGALSGVPLNLSIPVEKRGDTVRMYIKWVFEKPRVLKPGDSLTLPEEFVFHGKSDCFEPLRKYAEALSGLGVRPAESEPSAFDAAWCAWGYGRGFTVRQILGTLPEVKKLGIKWVSIDDGYQIAEGDWNLNPKTFPGGDAEMKNLVDSIHASGMKAMIWWAPLAADPGCAFLKKHPDAVSMDRKGEPYAISYWDSWYLSPSDTAVIAETKRIVRKFIVEYGFDGMKLDGQHLNCVHPDYNPVHHPDDPEYDCRHLPEFYKTIYETARGLKKDAVVQLCPCGDCFSVFNLPYVNQTVASDPESSYQVRTKAYVFRSLAPGTAYYGDHVELTDGGEDFASQLGVGAVPGTKFTWPEYGSDPGRKNFLDPEKEAVWKKAFGIYDSERMSEGEMLGGLYDIGYDKPETYVIRKGDGTFYYSLFAPEFSGTIHFRGLDKGTKYTVKDLWNDAVLGTVSFAEDSASVSFKRFELLKLNKQTN
ncbi:MAG: alpha-galactosidase [Bacteroidales bacterium]|nr:alpha-galactosidase [Bacteroidales bacterium]MCI2145935.1 alpha-galactosidase [Bacteroidales bacterium]